MSRENVELVRTVFEAVVSGDFDTAQELMTPDVVIVQPPEVPDAKVYQGSDAVRQGWEDWPRQWEEFSIELVEVIEFDEDTNIAVTRQHGRGRDSGIEMSFEVYFVSHNRDGRTFRMEMFFSREQALHAAAGEAG